MRSNSSWPVADVHENGYINPNRHTSILQVASQTAVHGKCPSSTQLVCLKRTSHPFRRWRRRRAPGRCRRSDGRQSRARLSNFRVQDASQRPEEQTKRTPSERR
ncbi:hypothetical protein FKM82_018608 [Ascaphus truei]